MKIGGFGIDIDGGMVKANLAARRSQQLDKIVVGSASEEGRSGFVQPVFEPTRLCITGRVKQLDEDLKDSTDLRDQTFVCTLRNVHAALYSIRWLSISFDQTVSAC